jgi:hypothetical protein
MLIQARNSAGNAEMNHWARMSGCQAEMEANLDRTDTQFGIAPKHNSLAKQTGQATAVLSTRVTRLETLRTHRRDRLLSHIPRRASISLRWLRLLLLDLCRCPDLQPVLLPLRSHHPSEQSCSVHAVRLSH